MYGLQRLFFDEIITLLYIGKILVLKKFPAIVQHIILILLTKRVAKATRAQSHLILFALNPSDSNQYSDIVVFFRSKCLCEA